MPSQDSANIYLKDVKRLFEYYKSLGEKSMLQVTDIQLCHIPAKASNSIALIVKHLHGNMTSRWTDFKTADGEKSWRNRDQEFEEPPKTRGEILQLWEKGWDFLFQALDDLNPTELTDIIYIRNEGQTILQAINRQLTHYSYHVGQLVFIARMLLGEKWQSLSIPKNQSAIYNAERFQKEQTIKHFTEK